MQYDTFKKNNVFVPFVEPFFKLFMYVFLAMWEFKCIPL